jgi:hypothetical protein
MAADKRAVPRVEVQAPVAGEVSVFAPISIRDISRTGVLVELAFPLQLNSLHEFRLALEEHAVVVRGRVVHCRIVEVDQDLVLYRAGIEFVEPSEHTAAAIAAFVSAMQHGCSTALSTSP